MSVIAIIGGSGFYDFDHLSYSKKHEIVTPFGVPSDVIVEGFINNRKVLFLTRHGHGHVRIPTEVNNRANVFALKRLGAEAIVSISAVGSLQKDIQPGDMVIVDQLVDRTKGRHGTFFGNGIAGHISFADPVCPHLSEKLFETAKSLFANVHRDKTLFVMEGPAFSTRAEASVHRKLGGDLISMTAVPEATLAREAEICYAMLGLVTDYDCWLEGESDVTVDTVKDRLERQSIKVNEIVVSFLRDDFTRKYCQCNRALDNAIVTDKKNISQQIIDDMKPIFGRILKS